MPKTRSEKRFERYLNDRGVGFEYEPDLGTSFKPDYRVFVGDTEAICEVKEFATNWLLHSPPVATGCDRSAPQTLHARVASGVEDLPVCWLSDVPFYPRLLEPAHKLSDESVREIATVALATEGDVDAVPVSKLGRHLRAFSAPVHEVVGDEHSIRACVVLDVL